MTLTDEQLIRITYGAIEATGNKPAEDAEDMLESIAAGDPVALAVLAGLRAVTDAAAQAESSKYEPFCWISPEGVIYQASDDNVLPGSRRMYVDATPPATDTNEK